MRIVQPLLILLFSTVLNVQAQSLQDKAKDLVTATLAQRGEELALTPLDWGEATVSDFYTSANGVSHLYLQQAWGGISMRGAILNANVFQGKVISLDHRFVTDLAGKIQTTQATLSQEQAIEAAASFLGLQDWSHLALEARPQGPAQRALFRAPGLSNDPISVQLSFASASIGQVRLAWEVRIYTSDHQHWWGVWVDAENAQILAKDDWVLHCSWDHSESLVTPGSDLAHTLAHAHEHSYRLAETPMELYAPFQPMATPSYRVFPYPVESPNHGARALVIDPSDVNASPFGWHDVDGVPGEEFTITRGNNVWAQEDRNGDNGIGLSPDGGSDLTFDFPLTFGIAPLNYLDASTTNLFFWNNLMHDVWYRYGFDEVSGNFQQNNYGKGGLGTDFVFADGQDGSGSNNANFATPPDGNNGRMQMFLWGTGGGSPNVLTINEPISIAGTFNAAGAVFGPGIPSVPLTGDLVLVIDSSGTNEGCSPILNASEINGKIALVNRGDCAFVTKVKACQDAGAIAVIVANNVGGGTFNMGGADQSINIPSIFITITLGNTIKSAMTSSTVNATIFDPGNPNARDGGFDNGIVAHEYGHGISTRLTGGPSTSCLFNEEQAGEGWSDFFSLVMTVKPSDVGTIPRGIGTFAVNEPTTGPGIRPYPYSTNMAVSLYTYDDVKSLSIPHGVGAVMCATLWDLYWKMVEEYGFDTDIYEGSGGNNLAMQLVIDGMKLQPCGPGFIDVRDAILLADQVNNAGANQCLIWEVFARRGLGFSADQGDPDDRSDGTEAFDIPPSCQKILFMDKTTVSTSVEQGGTVRYQFSIENNKEIDLYNLIISDTLPAPLGYVSGSSSCVSASIGNVVFINVDTLKAGQTIICEFDAQVPATATPSTFVFKDDIEGTVSAYIPTGQLGSSGWKLDGSNPKSGQQSWFVPNSEQANDQILMLPLAPLTSSSTLSFWHSYNTEGGFDGGVIEILPTLAGNQWLDLGPYIFQNGYNSTLATNNVLGSVAAFSGNSNGYVQTKIDLTAFLGQQLFIRWRFVSDDNTAVEGWWLDDISIGNERSFSNSACIVSDAGDSYCANQGFSTLIIEADTTTSLQDDVASFHVSLVPNPAQDFVDVRWNSPSGHQPVEIVLRNLMGQTLLKTPVAKGRESQHLDLHQLPAGVYVIEVKGTRHSVYRRMIVE